ncbi:MAG: ATP synthase F0 subunit B [Endomicrobium sp.]|jgi:F-type H+-transporting ATPase subunit b|nr:ATP synthase F0 subunit B [Endomicrobium sp.]
MGIIQKFGFNIKIFIFQLINFFIMYFFIKKILYNTLHRIIYQRKLQIKKTIKDAEQSKILIMNAIKEKDKIIQKAQAEATELINKTKNHINQLKQEAFITIKQQSKEMIDNAKKISTEELNKSRKEIKNMSLSIAEIITKKLLSDLLTVDENNKLITQALNKISIEYEKNTNS